MPALKIHASTTTAGGVKSATVSSVDGKPNAVKFMTYGDSETKAAFALARKMVEEGYDPVTIISVPVLGNVSIGRLV